MFENAIKKAARISHNLLDDELMRLEEYACAELIRAGVPDSAVKKGGRLIENAVVTRVLMEIGPEKSFDRAKQSWEYQLDSLRKHDWTVADV